MKRPSSFSDATGSNAADTRVEEAWLLWKLGRKNEVRELIEPILDSGAADRGILEIAVLLYLEDGRISKAEEYLTRLEQMAPEEKGVRALRADMHVRQKRWKEALEAYARLVSEHPEDMDYRTGYAPLLERANRWVAAREEYDVLMADGKKRDALKWAYRNVLEQGAPGTYVNGYYLQGPDGLWEYRLTEGVRAWPAGSVRVSFEGFESSYRQKAIGTAPSMKQSPAGHTIHGMWFINPHLAAGGRWEASYVGPKDSHELEAFLRAELGGFHSEAGYAFNHLLRSPIEGLNKRAHSDKLYMENYVLLFDRIRPGHRLEIEWYRVPPGQNEINAKRHLGHNVVNNAFMDVIILPEPYFSLNVGYKHAHWYRTFSDADQIIGIFKDENAVSFGFYFEHRMWEIVRYFATMTRNLDYKRDVQATYSNFGVDVWVRENMKFSFMFEYFYGDSGVAGSGNSQAATAGINVYF